MTPRAASILNVLAAYAFLAALAMAAQAGGHAVQHALAALGPDAALPALTRCFALPLLGLQEQGAWLGWLLWGGAALWPALALVAAVRSGDAPAALMLPWLLLVLAAVTLVLLGLWLPFSPM